MDETRFFFIFYFFKRELYTFQNLYWVYNDIKHIPKRNKFF